MGLPIGLMYREQIEAQYGEPLLSELEQIVASIREHLENITFPGSKGTPENPPGGGGTTTVNEINISDTTNITYNTLETTIKKGAPINLIRIQTLAEITIHGLDDSDPDTAQPARGTVIVIINGIPFSTGAIGEEVTLKHNSSSAGKDWQRLYIPTASDIILKAGMAAAFIFDDRGDPRWYLFAGSGAGAGVALASQVLDVTEGPSAFSSYTDQSVYSVSIDPNVVAVGDILHIVVNGVWTNSDTGAKTVGASFHVGDASTPDTLASGSLATGLGLTTAFNGRQVNFEGWVAVNGGSNTAATYSALAHLIFGNASGAHPAWESITSNFTAGTDIYDDTLPIMKLDDTGGVVCTFSVTSNLAHTGVIFTRHGSYIELYR